jgi:hypothetical protein
VVDQSLLRRAADRGVTICFADLDGADGLWVPEERTILVNRGLPDDRVAEVIDHELAHVMIDDQHADLDAGKDVLVGRLPRYRQPRAVALAAVSLFVVIGGATYGVSVARHGTKADQVAPNPGDTGLTAEESGSPTPSLSPSPVPGGGTVDVLVYPTPRKSSSTGSPVNLPKPSPTATRPIPSRTATHIIGGTPSRQPPTTSPAPSQPPPTSDQPPDPTPTSDPPSPNPTPEPTDGAAGGGTGDTGGAGGQGGVGDGIDAGPAGIGQGTVADVSVPPAPDNLTP